MRARFLKKIKFRNTEKHEEALENYNTILGKITEYMDDLIFIEENHCLRREVRSGNCKIELDELLKILDKLDSGMEPPRVREELTQFIDNTEESRQREYAAYLNLTLEIMKVHEELRTTIARS